MLNKYTRNDIMSVQEMKENYYTGYATYKADPVTIDVLRLLIENKKITIVMGTWCEDSKLQVPHFYKILDELGVEEKDVTLIFVNSRKQAENGLIDDLKIEMVPTFIFKEDNREIGRIIEHPAITLEDDMIKILTKK